MNNPEPINYLDEEEKKMLYQTGDLGQVSQEALEEMKELALKQRDRQLNPINPAEQ